MRITENILQMPNIFDEYALLLGSFHRWLAPSLALPYPQTSTK